MKSSPLLRGFSITISTIYLATNCALAHAPETTIWKERQSRHSRESGNPVISPDLKTQSKDWIPAFAGMTKFAELTPYGSIRKTMHPASSGPSKGTILHIQDVHRNVEAQTNIGLAIETLLKKDPATVLALEGAFHRVDLDRFNRYADRKSLKLVSDYFLKTGEMSGAIHAALSAKAANVIGVDHENLHRENVRAYLDAAPQQKKLKEELSKREQALEQQKLQAFNSSLRVFDQEVRRFQDNGTKLGAHAAALASRAVQTPKAVEDFLRALKMEKNLDFKQIEEDRAKNKYTPAIEAYVEYVLASRKLDVEKILEGIEQMQRDAYAALATTPREKALIAESRGIYLKKKILDFALTKTEWREYLSVIPAEAGIQRRLLQTWEQFYSAAEARDHEMARRLAGETLNSKNVVLVTGGFHSAGIDNRLVDAGYTVIRFTPRITKADAAGSGDYLNVFSQEKTPLASLFEGQKLFLAEVQTNPLLPTAVATAALTPADTPRAAQDLLGKDVSESAREDASGKIRGTVELAGKGHVDFEIERTEDAVTRIGWKQGEKIGAALPLPLLLANHLPLFGSISSVFIIVIIALIAVTIFFFGFFCYFLSIYDETTSSKKGKGRKRKPDITKPLATPEEIAQAARDFFDRTYEALAPRNIARALVKLPSRIFRRWVPEREKKDPAQEAAERFNASLAELAKPAIKLARAYEILNYLSHSSRVETYKKEQWVRIARALAEKDWLVTLYENNEPMKALVRFMAFDWIWKAGKKVSHAILIELSQGQDKRLKEFAKQVLPKMEVANENLILPATRWWSGFFSLGISWLLWRHGNMWTGFFAAVWESRVHHKPEFPWRHNDDGIPTEEQLIGWHDILDAQAKGFAWGGLLGWWWFGVMAHWDYNWMARTQRKQGKTEYQPLTLSTPEVLKSRYADLLKNYFSRLESAEIDAVWAEMERQSQGIAPEKTTILFPEKNNTFYFVANKNNHARITRFAWDKKSVALPETFHQMQQVMRRLELLTTLLQQHDVAPAAFPRKEGGETFDKKNTGRAGFLAATRAYPQIAQMVDALDENTSFEPAYFMHPEKPMTDAPSSRSIASIKRFRYIPEFARPFLDHVSPDGRFLAAVTPGAIPIWEVASGRLIKKIPSDLLYGSIFSPNGNEILEWGINGTKIHSIKTNKTESASFGGGASVNLAMFNGDGSKVLWTNFYSPRVYDSRREETETLTEAEVNHVDVAISGDGRWIISARHNNIDVFKFVPDSPGDRKYIHERTVTVMDNSNGAILSVALNHQGNVIFGGTSGGFIFRYDLNTNKRVTHNIHYREAVKIRSSANGSQVHFLMANGEIQTWDTNLYFYQSKVFSPPLERHVIVNRQSKIYWDNKYAKAESLFQPTEGRIKAVDLNSGELIAELLPEQEGHLLAGQPDNSGRYFYFVAKQEREDRLGRWEWGRKETAWSPKYWKLGGKFKAMAVSPNDNALAYVSILPDQERPIVRVFETKYVTLQNELPYYLFSPETDSVLFTPDSNHLALVGYGEDRSVGKRLIFWDWNKNKIEKNIQVPQSAYDCSPWRFSSDGRLLALSDGIHIVIVDLETDTWFDIVYTGKGTQRMGFSQNNQTFFVEGKNLLYFYDISDLAHPQKMGTLPAEFFPFEYLVDNNIDDLLTSADLRIHSLTLRSTRWWSGFFSLGLSWLFWRHDNMWTDLFAAVWESRRHTKPGFAELHNRGASTQRQNEGAAKIVEQAAKGFAWGGLFGWWWFGVREHWNFNWNARKDGVPPLTESGDVKSEITAFEKKFEADLLPYLMATTQLDETKTREVIFKIAGRIAESEANVASMALIKVQDESSHAYSMYIARRDGNQLTLYSLMPGIGKGRDPVDLVLFNVKEMLADIVRENFKPRFAGDPPTADPAWRMKSFMTIPHLFARTFILDVSNGIVSTYLGDAFGKRIWMDGEWPAGGWSIVKDPRADKLPQYDLSLARTGGTETEGEVPAFLFSDLAKKMSSGIKSEIAQDLGLSKKFPFSGESSNLVFLLELAAALGSQSDKQSKILDKIKESVKAQLQKLTNDLSSEEIFSFITAMGDEEDSAVREKIMAPLLPLLVTIQDTSKILAYTYDLTDPYKVSEVMSPDGRTFIAPLDLIADSQHVGAWDVATGRLRYVLQSDGPINALHFSRDSKFFVIGDGGRNVVVRDAESGEELGRQTMQQGEGLVSVSISADGEVISFAQQNGLVYAWNWRAEPSQPSRLVYNRPQTIVSEVAVNRDGTRIAVITLGRIALLEQQPSSSAYVELANRPIRENCTGLFFLDDGRIIFGTNYPATVHEWNGTNPFVDHLLENSSGQIAGVGRSLDGNSVKAHSHAGQLYTLPLPSLAPSSMTLVPWRRESLFKRQGSFWGISTNRDAGAAFQLGSAHQTTSALQRNDTIFDVTDDGTTAIWGRRGSTVSPLIEAINLLSLETASNVPVDMSRFTQDLAGRQVTTAIFSPNGANVGFRFVANNNQSVIAVAETNAGQTIAAIGAFRKVDAPLAFSPDGRVLAYVGRPAQNRGLYLWEWGAKNRQQRLPAPGDNVMALSFDRTGQRIAATTNTDLIVWENGAIKFTAPSVLPHVSKIKFSPDGAYIFGENSDQTAIWNASDGRLLRIFPRRVVPFGALDNRRLELLIHSSAPNPDAPEQAVSLTLRGTRVWSGVFSIGLSWLFWRHDNMWTDFFSSVWESFIHHKPGYADKHNGGFPTQPQRDGAEQILKRQAKGFAWGGLFGWWWYGFMAHWNYNWTARIKRRMGNVDFLPLVIPSGQSWANIQAIKHFANLGEAGNAQVRGATAVLSVEAEDLEELSDLAVQLTQYGPQAPEAYRTSEVIVNEPRVIGFMRQFPPFRLSELDGKGRGTLPPADDGSPTHMPAAPPALIDWSRRIRALRSAA